MADDKANPIDEEPHKFVDKRRMSQESEPATESVQIVAEDDSVEIQAESATDADISV